MTSDTRKKNRKQGKEPHCQCSPDCVLPPLPNSPFCRVHVKSCLRKAPLSGYEPAYEPDKYNKYPGIKESHNCYTYALNYLNLPKTNKCTKKSCPLPFPQPGRASGYPKWSEIKGKRCPDVLSRIMGDIPNSSLSTFEAKCPKKTRKIALVVDEGEDYHVLRQDADGKWSHKPGATDVIRHDATKRPIYDPELASRYYPQSGLHYDQFCSYMCIPSKTDHRLKRGGKRKTRRSKKHITSKKGKRKAIVKTKAKKKTKRSHHLSNLYFE